MHCSQGGSQAPWCEFDKKSTKTWHNDCNASFDYFDFLSCISISHDSYNCGRAPQSCCHHLQKQSKTSTCLKTQWERLSKAPKPAVDAKSGDKQWSKLGWVAMRHWGWNGAKHAIFNAKMDFTAKSDDKECKLPKSVTTHRENSLKWISKNWTNVMFW